MLKHGKLKHRAHGYPLISCNTFNLCDFFEQLYSDLLQLWQLWFDLVMINYQNVHHQSKRRRALLQLIWFVRSNMSNMLKMFVFALHVEIDHKIIATNKVIDISEVTLIWLISNVKRKNIKLIKVHKN